MTRDHIIHLVHNQIKFKLNFVRPHDQPLVKHFLIVLQRCLVRKNSIMGLTIVDSGSNSACNNKFLLILNTIKKLSTKIQKL